MQTEDHDLPEIDHTFVPRGTGGLLRVGLDLPADSRAPVSEVRLDGRVTATLDALRAELGAQPHAAEHLGLLERAYAPGAALSDAFATVFAEVFPEMLVVDPRTMPALAAPVHRRAIDEAAAIAGALQDQGAALADAGYGEQVHVRPGSPLCFFAPHGGARYRLDPAPDGWTVAGLHVTHAELRGWLERDPSRFTTSALLRPILQDTWLPTAAYVGGPGEIAYWAQLPHVYAHFGLPMPLVVPRARFRVVDDRSRALLDKLGLEPDDLAAPRDALLTRLARPEGFDAPEDAEARLVAALAPEFARLSGQMAALDPNLAKTAARTEESVRDNIAKLVAKYARALAQRDQVAVERLDRLRGYLAPDGVPQERVHGLPYYASRWGTRGFARTVLDACVPFDGALRDLVLS
jgi:bacillithiol biosynthesis cysteine-adding enzyme BshC